MPIPRQLKEDLASFQKLPTIHEKIDWLEAMRGRLEYWAINVDGLIEAWERKMDSASYK